LTGSAAPCALPAFRNHGLADPGKERDGQTTRVRLWFSIHAHSVIQDQVSGQRDAVELSDLPPPALESVAKPVLDQSPLMKGHLACRFNLSMVQPHALDSPPG